MKGDAEVYCKQQASSARGRSSRTAGSLLRSSTLTAIAVAAGLVARPGWAQDAPWASSPSPAHRPSRSAAAKPRASKSPGRRQSPAPAQSGASRAKAGPELLLAQFRKLLAPHGRWVEQPGYGSVWIPDPKQVGEAFVPYLSAGRFALTQPGDWAWVSDLDWGRVPFHYGRWLWTRDRGWAWVPGTDYAPAWVAWRVPDSRRGFVGWAPMPPAAKVVQGAAARAPAPRLPFYFVRARKLFAPRLEGHFVEDRKLAETMYRRSHLLGGHGRADGGGDVAHLRAASPSLLDVELPAAAVPRTRLAPSEPDPGRFATPPPGEPAKQQAAAAARQRAEAWRQARTHRARRARQARRARSIGPRYRCWPSDPWRPVWRCSY